jgi:hypothetical protein
LERLANYKTKNKQLSSMPNQTQNMNIFKIEKP